MANQSVRGLPLVVDLPTQARYVAQSLYLHWKAGAQLSTYYGLDIDPLGCFFSDGTQKPAFDAFRFPFVADPQRKGKVLIRGNYSAAGQLEIQRARAPNGWRREAARRQARRLHHEAGESQGSRHPPAGDRLGREPSLEVSNLYLDPPGLQGPATPPIHSLFAVVDTEYT